MPERQRLPNRRAISTAVFAHVNGRSTQHYIASVAKFEDGGLAEIFINTSGKAGNEADVNASDCAVAISLALQFGCPAETLRQALKRNADGSPTGPLAHALDLFSEDSQ